MAGRWCRREKFPQKVTRMPNLCALFNELRSFADSGPVRQLSRGSADHIEETWRLISNLCRTKSRRKKNSSRHEISAWQNSGNFKRKVGKPHPRPGESLNNREVNYSILRRKEIFLSVVQRNRARR